MTESITCALIFKNYQSRRMLRPVERVSSKVGSGDICKTCRCNPNKKGHTIEECIEFKNGVRHLLDMDNIANSWGDDVIIACVEPKLDILVISKTKFYRCFFTRFKKTMLEVYSEFVRNRVFTPIYKDVEMSYSLGFEVQNPCPITGLLIIALKIALRSATTWNISSI